MNKRNIPFGYIMTGGEFIPNRPEADAVKQIFNLYLQGWSLQAIADTMTVPYGADLDWDKHKIKRILDNSRYIGVQDYPVLIDSVDFSRAQKLKTKKNVSTPIAVESDIQLLKTATRCHVCNRRFIRRVNRHGNEHWRCANSNCENETALRDIILKNAVTGALDYISQNPDAIQTSTAPSPTTLAITKLQNEINREMSKVNPDADHIRSLLFACAAEKYAAIDGTAEITIVLREAFAAHTPTGEFNRILFADTVDKVFITANGTVLLQLNNGQTLPVQS